MSAYGTDWSTYDATTGRPRLDVTGNTISGPRVVLERCVRRLSTQSGALVGSELFGLDLMSYAGKRMTPLSRARLKSDIEAELARDEAVRSARVSSITDSLGVLTIRISLSLDTGTLDLVVRASELSVDLLSQDVG